MGAVAEGSPSIRAQANLSALGLHEMAASLPDYVRMVAAGERETLTMPQSRVDIGVRYCSNGPSAPERRFPCPCCRSRWITAVRGAARGSVGGLRRRRRMIWMW